MTNINAVTCLSCIERCPTNHSDCKRVWESNVLEVHSQLVSGTLNNSQLQSVCRYVLLNYIKTITINGEMQSPSTALLPPSKCRCGLTCLVFQYFIPSGIEY